MCFTVVQKLLFVIMRDPLYVLYADIRMLKTVRRGQSSIPIKMYTCCDGASLLFFMAAITATHLLPFVIVYGIVHVILWCITPQYSLNFSDGGVFIWDDVTQSS